MTCIRITAISKVLQECLPFIMTIIVRQRDFVIGHD
jgi:hypothetical protein